MEINLEMFRSNEDWLRFFAQIGQQALQLLKTNGSPLLPIGWDQLRIRFFSEAYPPVSQASRPDHDRWLNRLQDWARRHEIMSPDGFTREHAALLATELFADGTAPARRFRFYRRVWRTLGLNQKVWNTQEALSRRTAAEHYRRLTTAELKRLVATARKRDDDLADMILIGYWTGLRLSDVTELERSEVQLSRRALRIVPNKVRERKHHPLTIPLIGDAETIIRERMRQTNNAFLFDSICRVHPSRRIGRLFKASRIKKIGNGRASFHSLRATFISLMDEAGIQPYITDAITGHSGGGMHARYTQPSPAVLRQAMVRAIPNICPCPRTRCPMP